MQTRLGHASPAITLSLYVHPTDAADQAAADHFETVLRQAVDGKKKTPAQHFAQLFALFTGGATEGERAAAERKMDAWLKRHGKTRADIAGFWCKPPPTKRHRNRPRRNPTRAMRRPVRSTIRCLPRPAWSKASWRST